jgi:predicted choloylglycine hydrolase
MFASEPVPRGFTVRVAGYAWVMPSQDLREETPARYLADVTFRSVVELQPGPALGSLFGVNWPAYRNWFLRDGEEARPSYAVCQRALAAHVPELLPTWERLVELVGGGDLESRFLSLWEPPPFFAACSVATWTRDGRPGLVRTYDYVPALCETTVLTSAFCGRRTVAMADCLWGALDGMNEDGLAVAISFGGRRVVGRGFAVTLLVRYLLEHCSDVPAALDAIYAVPVNLAYNVALVDRSGASALVVLAPDHEPAVIHGEVCAANRQGRTEWHEHAVMSETVVREAAMAAALADPAMTRDGLEQIFLTEPVHRPLERHTWGTVYTASYDVIERSLRLLWPSDEAWEVQLDTAVPGEITRRTMTTLPPLLERPRQVPHTPEVIFA